MSSIAYIVETSHLYYEPLAVVGAAGSLKRALEMLIEDSKDQDPERFIGSITRTEMGTAVSPEDDNLTLTQDDARVMLKAFTN